jgi:hypothetical protein
MTMGPVLRSDQYGRILVGRPGPGHRGLGIMLTRDRDESEDGGIQVQPEQVTTAR